MATFLSKAARLPLPLAAAAMPVAFGPFFRDPYNVPKLAAAGACAAAGALLLAASGELASVRSRLDVPLAAAALVLAACAILSVEPDLSRWGGEFDHLLGLPGLAACASAYWLGCAQGRGDGGRRLLRWAVLGAVPVSVYALLQAAGWEPFSWRPAGFSLGWSPALQGGRVHSSLGTAPALGAYLAVVIPAALALGEAPAERRLAWGSAALATAALAATRSRAAVLAALAGAALPVVLRRKRGGLWLVLGAAAALVPWSWTARSLAPVSDDLRGRIWATAWRAFCERPWLGWGVDAFVVPFRRLCPPEYAQFYAHDGVATHAHNDWLQVLATTGVLGAAAYAWLHAALFLGLRDSLRAGALEARAAAGAAGALLVAAKFNSPSLCAAWLGAALAGGAMGRLPSGGRRVPSGALMLACALFCAYSAAVWARADLLNIQGRRLRSAGRPREAAALLEEAAALLPGPARNRIDLANLLFDVAGDAEPAARGLILERAAGLALVGLARRPNDPENYRLLARAELRRSEAGFPRLGAARAALDAALELDPAYPFVEELSKIPELQGDLRTSRRLRARLNPPGVPGVD